MMEGTAPAFSPQITTYLNAWAENCAQVVSTVAGATVTFDIALNAPPESAARADSDVWLSVALSGALNGSMHLRMNRAEATAVAQRFMGESADTSAEFKPEYQESMVELFRQIAGHVATALKPLRGEVGLQVDKADAPAWAASITAWIQSSSDSVKLVIETLLSSELVAALSAPKPESPPAAVVEVPAEPPLGVVEPAAKADSVPPPLEVGEIEATPIPKNLDLVMDIELGVALRFGTRQLLLKDILELTAGSVVELDQHVQEPVELLLDGRLIARGEVVVIDGNYGFRVNDVIRSDARV